MKDPIILISAILFIFCFTAAAIDRNTPQPEIEKMPTFIWNDTDESIPADGELVQIEFTKGDTIYLTPSPDQQ